VTIEPADDGRDPARKGPDAFRTISEVAEELGLPQHVLRFWESRFPQIKPVKRGGGRRYYRPNDVDLLRGVKQLLYGEGYTIKGVQRILREQGGRKLAQAAGVAPADRAEPSFQPEAALDVAGPELWAPQRREAPDRATALDDPGEAGRPYSEPIGASASAFHPPALGLDPAETRSGLTDGQAARLRAALDELVACRRLIAGRA
jgi:DNA-binding transcriptional MerR regulator